MNLLILPGALARLAAVEIHSFGIKSVRRADRGSAPPRALPLAVSRSERLRRILYRRASVRAPRSRPILAVSFGDAEHRGLGRGIAQLFGALITLGSATPSLIAQYTAPMHPSNQAAISRRAVAPQLAASA